MRPPLPPKRPELTKRPSDTHNGTKQEHHAAPTGQLLEAVRQFLGPRHVRAVDEDRDDRNAALKRRLDFDAHEIVGVVETTPVILAGARAVSKRIESRGIPESGLFMIHDARRAKEAAEMALSDDLRKRVVEAVTDGGMSRNAAAKRFGVSIASAVRWLHRFAATGEISPAPTGGDRRSDRIEAHRDYLLGLIRRQPDMTLLEIQERLIANCG